jgi:hypothetical protein
MSKAPSGTLLKREIIKKASGVKMSFSVEKRKGTKNISDVKRSKALS